MWKAAWLWRRVTQRYHEWTRIDANKDEPQIDADIRSPGRGLMKVEKLQARSGVAIIARTKWSTPVERCLACEADGDQGLSRGTFVLLSALYPVPPSF